MRRTPAPAGRTGPAPPEIDRRQLLDAAGGDRDLAAELVTLFATDAARILAELDRALAARDMPAVRAAAHSLKGSALTVGFLQLAESARLIEEAAARGDVVATRIEEVRGQAAAIDPRRALG